MGLFLICCGASISFKQVGAPLYKGALLTVLKLIIGIAIGWGVQYMFGNEGIFGITPVALIAVLTNSSGSIYATLADRFGDSTDVGAVSVLSINDGPFLTMVALGATRCLTYRLWCCWQRSCRSSSELYGAILTGNSGSCAAEHCH